MTPGDQRDPVRRAHNCPSPGARPLIVRGGYDQRASILKNCDVIMGRG